MSGYDGYGILNGIWPSILVVLTCMTVVIVLISIH